MARYRVWADVRGGAVVRGGWEAGGELNPLLGLFVLPMSPRSASHRPKHAGMMYQMSFYHWGDFKTHAFHVTPSMGPNILVMNLQGWQNLV